MNRRAFLKGLATVAVAAMLPFEMIKEKWEPNPEWENAQYEISWLLPDGYQGVPGMSNALVFTKVSVKE